MACPFFFPVEQVIAGAGTRRPRSPLGVECRGACRADPESAFEPDDGALSLCNFGYGRGLCPRFPDSSLCDAVRFSITRNGTIVFVLERDFSPLQHGVVEGHLPGECLQRQAEVFALACGNRRARA